MEIPQQIKDEFFYWKSKHYEPSVWYNSENNTFFVLLFDCWKPKSLLIQRLPDPEKQAIKQNNNFKIKTLNLCQQQKF